MRKVFHVIGWTVVIVLPWTWIFSWHIWLQPLIGNFWGQASIFGVALVVLAWGIYLNAKGYGRQEPVPVKVKK